MTPLIEISDFTFRSHDGTVLVLSTCMYRLMTVIDRNDDSVIRIILRQNNAPVHNETSQFALHVEIPTGLSDFVSYLNTYNNCYSGLVKR